MGYVSITTRILRRCSLLTTFYRAEISLGIIATNLGLSRSMYYYLFKKEQDTRVSSHPHSYGSRSRSGPTGRIEQSLAMQSERRGSSAARSQDSDMPLKPVIHKRTEISIHSKHETRDG
jgi:hypothetical protein